MFNVTDQDGNKITAEEVLDYIQKVTPHPIIIISFYFFLCQGLPFCLCGVQSLGPESCFMSTMGSVGFKPTVDHTVIELTGSDRPGLLSEVSAVLTHLKCNIVGAEVWTHNTRAAAVMHVTDQDANSPITDPERLSRIKELLCHVLKGSNNSWRAAKTLVSHEQTTHTARRLHQMMFDDRDYERAPGDDTAAKSEDQKLRPMVEVVNCYDKDYSVVTIRSKDRPKLLFDTVCTLTDMQYVVFHANIDAEGPEAYQVTKATPRCGFH